VPAILISPMAPKGVVHTVFDHTSILHYAEDKWSRPPLNARDAAANSIAQALDFNSPPRADTPTSVQASITAPVPVAGDSTSVANHEQGLLSFGRYLDAAMDHQGDQAIQAYQRLQKEYQEGLEAKIDVAKQRFNLFLQGTKTHLKGITRDSTPSNPSSDTSS